MAQRLMALQMVSIPIKNLEVLVKELVIEMKKEIQEPSTGYTSEDLRLYFQRNKIFPPETYYNRNFFSAVKPRVALTYMWPATPIETFVVLLKRRYTDDDTVYIDILLNDQRTQVSIQVSLSNADVRYMESQHHLIIVGCAVYPTYGSDGKENGREKCWIFDRCWCMREMAIRDCIAVKKFGHQKSEIIVMDEFLAELTSCAESGKSICTEVAQMFRNKDFFGDLKGRPEDVVEIKSTLISQGFFESARHFNEHFSRRMVSVFVTCIPQVTVLKRKFCV